MATFLRLKTPRTVKCIGRTVSKTEFKTKLKHMFPPVTASADDRQHMAILTLFTTDHRELYTNKLQLQQLTPQGNLD